MLDECLDHYVVISEFPNIYESLFYVWLQMKRLVYSRKVNNLFVPAYY